MLDDEEMDIYKECLIKAAPDILWFNVQDVGGYQGRVYAVGKMGRQYVMFADYYGSCSACGAWGYDQGGEPEDQDEVLSKSALFFDTGTALDYARKEWSDDYDPVDLYEVRAALDEARTARTMNGTSPSSLGSL